MSLALDTARDLQWVSLEDALALVVAMARQHHRGYELAAARLAQRVISEQRLGLTDARQVLALIEVLPLAPDAATVALRSYVAQAQAPS